MKSELKPKLFVWGLSAALLAAVVALAFVIYQNFWWRKCVDYYTNQAGASQAMSTFRRGHLVLWMIEDDNENLRFSGRKEGPFEVWLDEYHSYMPASWHYAQRRHNEAHNQQMRFMYEHPERFKNFGSDAGISSSNAPTQTKAN